MSRSRIALLSGAQLLSFLLGGCALLTPLPAPTTLEERLAAIPIGGLPLKGRTVIHWDAHQIPFIEAEHDEDAAVALGLVHAHLRLGQMEVMRRISQGRLAEMGGPVAVEIDHALRILGYGRATAATEAALPPATRAWLAGFVKGINHYQRNVKRLPVEFAVLGLAREPWTIADVLTIGRLAGTDVNWLVWFNVLKLRGRPDWPQIWARLVENGRDSVPSYPGEGEEVTLGRLLSDTGRSGSNSLAVSGRRTQHGAAIIANDPHLGIYLPNLWLVAGLKSPSIHAVGVMTPGLPIFALGRNPWIAWGGTNMRAASSDLYDASGLAPGDWVEREETVKVRWWFDQTVKLRDTRWGPVLSDAPQLRGAAPSDFVLRWTGHLPSDEVTAMLALSRARSFEDFRAAFRTFALPGQNMLYADNDGNIGMVSAVQLPKRTGPPPPDLILDPEIREPAWQDIQDVRDLPFVFNPSKGYLASANNRPAESEVQLGYFFSPDDRVNRMAQVLEATEAVSLEDVQRLQLDVFMESSAALRDLFLAKIEELGLEAEASATERRVIEEMRVWDGRYDMASRGAVAFELFRHGFTGSFYSTSFGDQDWAAFAAVGRIKSLMLEDLQSAEAASLAASLKTALGKAAAEIDSFEDWGDMHRLRLSHPLSFLPLVGGRYRFADHPVAGSSDTLMKTAHASTSERHATRYGANARHVSDLSDPDLNYFALLGGQDGWINSSTFMSQVPLWRAGDYIQVPLRLEKVRARAAHTTRLAP